VVGCQSLEGLAREAAQLGSPATVVPAEARRVRIARPGLSELSAYGAQALVAGERARERAVKYEVEAWPVTETIGRPDAPVTTAVTDPERWPDLFAAQVASATPSDAPDLVLTSGSLVSALGRARALHDLGPLLRDERWFKADDFVDGVLRAGQVGGQQLAIPLSVGAEALVYRSSIFEEAGATPPRPDWSWQDLVRAARAVRRGAGGSAARWGILVRPLSPTLFSLAWQQGAQLIPPDGARLELTEAGTVRAVEFLVDLIQGEGVAPAIDEKDEPPFAALWGQKRFAIAPTLISGPVWWHTVVNEGTELCELPEQRRGLVGFASILVGIPRAAPDLKHSLNALRGLVEGASRVLVLPARRAAPPLRQMNNLLSDNDAAVLSSALGALRFLPGDFPWTQIAPIVSRELMVPALAGRKSARQAARDAQTFVDRRIAELRGA
jgi:hypothetical protein